MGEFVVKTYALPQTGEVHSIANYEDKSSFRDIVDEQRTSRYRKHLLSLAGRHQFLKS
jgi:hypothetical protein